MFFQYLLLFALIALSHMMFGGKKGAGGDGGKAKASKGMDKKKKKTKKTGKKRTKKKGKKRKSLGIRRPGRPSIGKAAKGVKAVGKGMKFGAKGVIGVAKGARAGVVAARDARRGLSRGSDGSSTADLEWRKRPRTEIEENPELPPIKSLPLPRIDMSFYRPRLARKSREFNSQLRKDWKYLIDENGEIRFDSGRYGAKFLLPVGFPPAE